MRWRARLGAKVYLRAASRNARADAVRRHHPSFLMTARTGQRARARTRGPRILTHAPAVWPRRRRTCCVSSAVGSA